MDQEMIVAINAFAIGIFAGIYLKNHWKWSSVVRAQRINYKRDVYKEVIILMYRQLNFTKSQHYLADQGVYGDPEEIMNELKERWNRMLLSFPETVLKTMWNFIINPTKEHLYDTALSMRKDIGKGEVKLTLQEYYMV